MSDKSPQERIFHSIIGYKRNHDGNSPSVRELQAACKISSTSVVKRNLQRLENNGLIRLSNNTARQIEVVGGEWKYKKPDSE